MVKSGETRIKTAEYLGVSTSTVNNYVNRGWIPEGIKKAGSS